MHDMTQQNLINAFGGESMAHMRYLHFANQAHKEGFGNVQRLFKAIAHAEYVHAGNHYRELKHLNGGFQADSGATGGPGDTRKNLELGIMGEAFEIAEMYPVYIEVAKFQGEKGALKTCEWAYKTEQQHKELFERAKKSVAGGQDMTLGKMGVCEVCGCTLEGDLPDFCPICGAKREKFSAFD
jgi:rubrerythrin